MPAARTATLSFILVLAVSPAWTQTPSPAADAIGSGLGQVLSMATFGAITVQSQDAEVTRNGENYRVRLPLAGFSAPPGAAINALVHPIEHGLLDVTAMTLPSEGTLETAPAGDVPDQITYTIGQQSITAKIDPSLAVPSSYVAEFAHVQLLSDHGEQRGEQSLDRYSANGTLSADAAGRVSMASQGNGTGFHFLGHGANGFASDTTVRALAGHFAVEGLDRAQGTRLMAAFRDARAATTSPGQPGVTPDQRQALRAMVDSADGLLNRFDAEETLEDVRFTVGAGKTLNSGSIGRVRLNMAGDAAHERLNTRLGITLDHISASALSAENDAFIPHHVDLKATLAGVRIAPLMALLRAATEPDADPVALQAQAMALFADPQAHIGIESLSFDSGPLQITGSAKILPLPSGQPGAEIHIAATGVDALLAQAQSQPNLQGLMPMVFMAKGMGRQQGDSLIWDISMGDGPMTINGTPFGQPAGRTR